MSGSVVTDCILRPIKVLGGQWRGVTLRGINLSKLDLSGLDLREADLSLADLSGTVLRGAQLDAANLRSEEHTSELQSLMRISYAVFCLKKKRPSSYIVKSLYSHSL